MIDTTWSIKSLTELEVLTICNSVIIYIVPAPRETQPQGEDGSRKGRQEWTSLSFTLSWSQSRVLALPTTSIQWPHLSGLGPGVDSGRSRRLGLWSPSSSQPSREGKTPTRRTLVQVPELKDRAMEMGLEGSAQVNMVEQAEHKQTYGVRKLRGMWVVPGDGSNGTLR